MTSGERRALGIIRKHGPLRPSEFADLFWPGKHWTPMRCGTNGVSRTRNKAMSAGAYIGRLRKKGWIRFAPYGENGVVLTSKAKEELNVSE